MPRRNDTSDRSPGKGTHAPGGTQAVVRAIRLLKAVAESPRALSLDELATSFSLSKPTAHRILSALVSEGMVVQDEASRQFSAGPESLALSANALRKHNLRSLSRPVMEKLVTQFGETVTLEIPVRDEMLIVDELASSNLVGAVAEVGNRWPMYATSSGKLFLSALSAVEQNELLAEKRRALTPKTLVQKRQLLEAFKAARKHGYALAQGELQEGFSAVSAAIRNSLHEVIATISLGGPSSRLSSAKLKSIGESLADESEKLSRQLAIGLP